MIKILLAQEDEKLADIYKRRFQPPLMVDSATNGLVAFRKINRTHPQIILSDYDLPVVSGLQLLEYVRSHPKMFATPFLFLTRRLASDESLGLGATDWIHIPSHSPDMVVEKTIYYLKLSGQLSINNVSR